MSKNLLLLRVGSVSVVPFCIEPPVELLPVLSGLPRLPVLPGLAGLPRLPGLLAGFSGFSAPILSSSLPVSGLSTQSSSGIGVVSGSFAPILSCSGSTGGLVGHDGVGSGAAVGAAVGADVGAAVGADVGLVVGVV